MMRPKRAASRLFVGAGAFQVDPHRLQVGQGFEAVDLFLEEPAVGQREDVEHAGR
jgi:hypothetical protein